MIDPQRFRLSKHALIRMIADAVMVNIAMIVALGSRYLYVVGVQTTPTGVGPRELLMGYTTGYADSGWILTLIAIGVFVVSGLYTDKRTHRIRYRTLSIAQGVTVAFLLFGFFSYFFSGGLPVPRGTLVGGWIGSVVLMTGSRFWSNVWRNIVLEELEHDTADGEETVENVLVIGGAGYIGSALLPKLLDEGYNVRLLDLLLYGTEPIEEVVDHEHLEIVEGDLRHSENVVQAMQGIDAVIHLGAIVGDPACELDEKATIEINLAATRMIAAVAKAADIERFIFASTCSVYGAAETDEMLDEQSVLRPVSLYARSKIASERVLRQMADEDFQPTYLRFGTIYGLSGRTRFDLVVNLLTAKAKHQGKITIYGGDQWRPFVHVDDAARGIHKALRAPLEIVGNEIFNIGSDAQNYTIDQVGEVIHEQVPDSEIVHVGPDADARDYRVSFEKARNKLTYLPNWSLADGVRQVVDAIDNGEVEDWTAAKYSNVKFLTQRDSPALLDKHGDWAQELIDDTGHVQAPVQELESDQAATPAE